MLPKTLLEDRILTALSDLANEGLHEVYPNQLRELPASPSTIRRYLNSLVESGKVRRIGKARATRYQLISQIKNEQDEIEGADLTYFRGLSKKSLDLLTQIKKPIGTRRPVTYQRAFVDDYIPNQTWLLPQRLAESLFSEGRTQGQQPAGTYARQVLEPLLIDLSWASSHLEGNRHTLLDTERLFKDGVESPDSDAVMLLNHKRSIEFLVDAVPEYGLSTGLIRNLQSILMQDLLKDPRGLGEIRTKIVNISDTTYLPSQVPSLLEEMLKEIIQKACEVKIPTEAAFFLWVNIAYLQPFEDGNKRTSRLAANIPLMLYNCSPLSFIGVDTQDYAHAMLGVYEHTNPSLAADLFAWAYRRSVQKYGVILESVGAPDPFRITYRETLSQVIQSVVRDHISMSSAIDKASIPEKDRKRFEDMLDKELSTLGPHNCARFRLGIRDVEEWVWAGRAIF